MTFKGKGGPKKPSFSGPGKTAIVNLGKDMKEYRRKKSVLKLDEKLERIFTEIESRTKYSRKTKSLLGYARRDRSYASIMKLVETISSLNVFNDYHVAAALMYKNAALNGALRKAPKPNETENPEAKPSYYARQYWVNESPADFIRHVSSQTLEDWEEARQIIDPFFITDVILT